MSATVTIKVRRELVELAEKMVRYGIAKDKSHAFNIMMEREAKDILQEVEFWDRLYERVEELEISGYRLEGGGLTKLLEEGRGRCHT